MSLAGRKGGRPCTRGSTIEISVLFELDRKTRGAYRGKKEDEGESTWLVQTLLNVTKAKV